MTKKPKKQLFNSYLCHTAILVSVLVGFFTYAFFFNNSFFIYIAVGLIISIIYLIPVRGQLIKKQSEVDLQVQDFHERTNLVEAESRAERVAIESFRDKIVNFSQLKGMTERLSMCLTLEDTSKTLSAEVNRLFGDKETTIILYLFHSKTGELGLTSSQKGQMRVNIKSKKGDIFDQWIVKTMQSLLIEDTKSDYRFDIDKIATEDARAIRSLISAPLMVGNKALGIIRIDSAKENYFGTEDLRFLKTICDIGAIAIENAQLYEHVENLAIKDGLTELYLRRYLQDRLPEEISRHLRGRNQLSLMMIDIDHFKQYNDKFGHVAGDIVLKTIGKLLKNFFKEPGSLVCRYGGEEFSVLLPHCTKQKAMELAEEIRGEVEKETFFLRREKTHVTASIGVASFPKDATIKEELIQKADQALYKAKEYGRNQVCAA